MRGPHQLLGDPSVAPEVGKYWLLLTQRQEVPCLELVSPLSLTSTSGSEDKSCNQWFIYLFIGLSSKVSLSGAHLCIHTHTHSTQSVHGD